MSAEAAAGTATSTSIDELIGGYARERISRQRVLAALTAAGASAAAVGMLLNAVEQAAPPSVTIAAGAAHTQVLEASAVGHAQAHARHVADQVAGTKAPSRDGRAAAVAKMMGDYSPNAVVNDPLFGAPLVGAAAIAVHKTAEMAAISDVAFTVLSREVLSDQLFSTWEMSGVHDGPFYAYKPTGRRIHMSGATVQRRAGDGKLLSESLYYDAADMHRQLAGG
jgi:SnoaL-like polyketide cyclase